MHVQRVAMPSSRAESWTVLGDDDIPVWPVERYLAYLTAIGRSPNTIKAYAHDLKDFFTFLGWRGLDWREARLEDIGEYERLTDIRPASRPGSASLSVIGPALGLRVRTRLTCIRRWPQGSGRGVCALVWGGLSLLPVPRSLPRVLRAGGRVQGRAAPAWRRRRRP